MVLEEIQHPIVLAPLAGGASTAELAAAVSEAGGLGFLASGYLTPEVLEERMVSVRERTEAPFGVNLFVPGDPQAETPGLEDYLQSVAPEAGRYGAGLARQRLGDVDLHDWPSRIFERVAERHAVMGRTAGIDDDRVSVFSAFLEPVDQRAFVIRLERLDLRAGSSRSSADCRDDLGQCDVPVRLRVAPPQPVEIRAVHQENVHHATV